MTLPKYSLDDWLLFAALAQENSFSRAAKKLGIDVSVLSKRIARLEKQLGTKLVLRTTRQMTLTDAGHLFQQSCAKLCADLDDFSNHWQALQQKPSGRLRIKAPLGFGHTYLAPIISEFLQYYADINVDLILGDHSYNLLKDNIDILLSIKALDDPNIDLVAKQIGIRSSGVYSSPAYLKQHGIPQHPHELIQHNCLLHRERSEKNNWRFINGHDEINVMVSGNLCANSNEALLAAACTGLGLVKLPSFLASAALAEGRLVEVLSSYKLPAHGIYAMYMKQSHMPLKIKVFIDFLAQYFSKRQEFL